MEDGPSKMAILVIYPFVALDTLGCTTERAAWDELGHINLVVNYVAEVLPCTLFSNCQGSGSYRASKCVPSSKGSH